MLRLIFLLLVLSSQLAFANDSFIIGIAGGSGSGKTKLSLGLQEVLGSDAILIQQDAYYKDLSHMTLDQRKNVNFDHPDSIDFDLLLQHLHDLKNGKSIIKPHYDFITHSRTSKSEEISPAKIVIVEGILLLAIPDIRDVLDIKIYTDVDDDIRLLRRLERDTLERGRDFTSVKNQYLATVKPMYEQFVAPSKQHADLIIPSLSDTTEAERIIISRLKDILQN